MVQLPPFRVIAPPEVATYGGLVVNMPTWLQIQAAAWRPYFTDVDEYMGWYSQLGLFPASWTSRWSARWGDGAVRTGGVGGEGDGAIPGCAG